MNLPRHHHHPAQYLTGHSRSLPGDSSFGQGIAQAVIIPVPDIVCLQGPFSYTSIPEGRTRRYSRLPTRLSIWEKEDIAPGPVRGGEVLCRGGGSTEPREGGGVQERGWGKGRGGKGREGKGREGEQRCGEQRWRGGYVQKRWRKKRRTKMEGGRAGGVAVEKVMGGTTMDSNRHVMTVIDPCRRPAGRPAGSPPPHPKRSASTRTSRMPGHPHFR